MVEGLGYAPITAFQIVWWTRHDSLMPQVTNEFWKVDLKVQVRNCDLTGWEGWSCRLTMGAGIVWGGRMVIPHQPESIYWLNFMKDTQECQGWKLSCKVWCGGQAWTTKSRMWLDIVLSVNELKPHHPQLCSIRLHVCGQDYMWILQVLWMAECT